METVINKTGTVRVLVVQDHELVESGLKSLLQDEPAVRVIGQVASRQDAHTEIIVQDPDVIVMELNAPLTTGLQYLRELKTKFPEKKVLVRAAVNHEGWVVDLLDAGADGYVMKSAPKEELVFALRKVASHGAYTSAEFTLGVLARYKSMQREQPLNYADLHITQREMDVLKLVAEGKTNVEIARQLFTSVRTIETRRKNLLDKTKTNNTASLIRFAVKNGLVN